MILSDEGVTLASVPEDQLSEVLEKLLNADAPRPKIISGVITDDTSTDQFQARFRYIKESFALLEKYTGYQFARVELLPNGELLAKPSRVGFVVQFDKGWGQEEGFKEEVERLKLVLPEIKDRLADVVKIDLAYNKIAVVSYKSEK